jgi:hypothetical protein
VGHQIDPGVRVTLFPSIDATQGIFFGWGGDCAGFAANESCEVVMSRNKSVTIVYASLPVPTAEFPTLTIRTDIGAGTGCVSANGPSGSSGCLASGDARFPRGAVVNLATAADQGFVFGGTFFGDCTFLDGDTIVMDHSCQVLVPFDAPTAPPPRPAR